MMRHHKHILKRVIFGSAIILGALMIGAISITLITNSNQYATEFMTGSLPEPLDGFYRGVPLFLIQTGTMWQGKIFDTATQTGWNHFTEGNKYPFKTYVTTAIGDVSQKVIRLDYDIPSNPWYVRIIRDELVQVSETRYLGKLNLDILPYFPIAIGYFQLEISASVNNGCLIGGCSKELCSDRELFSTCNFKNEYICYRSAQCERQKNGQCGWTQTKELTQCLKEKMTINKQ